MLTDSLIVAPIILTIRTIRRANDASPARTDARNAPEAMRRTMDRSAIDVRHTARLQQRFAKRADAQAAR
ncbi:MULTISPECIES: hypothetical protein [unclassified Mesorhizobium]|uniref:hypothetical protein n=1 Tax=unclassified Mesorhizobium TaxID=325217 RepID=UPI000F74FB37|nr:MULTISPECIES: hypothetical protein [unclassified Mesorhizobium]AZO34123.1 hypothetical protein EJ072_06195 [Mesorhizobium sp. M2A.F.Ca.ET.046.03.2.1]AZO71552.1 hypothetical protein EJ067_10575 [Mesorhizobium sp. M1D.F.Ca.ET.043.01.1.1]RVC70133.1 hypothetical protein EN766_28400 [Mesorhizobium sp. M2A.F.Ca.ET.046.02.1.1]RWB39370.1 MAG: hypothetical protein EOQ44_28095 [Mesorhizobium sp.]